MKFIFLLTSVFILVLLMPCVGPGESTTALYEQATKSLQEKAYADYLKYASLLVEKAPKHPSLLLMLAKAQALNQQPEQALKTLQKVVQLGGGNKIEEVPEFDSLKKLPQFQEIASQLKQNREIKGKSEIAFRIPQKDLIPEGIAYDPVSKTFYVSSIYLRKIVQIDSSGKTTDFIAEGQDGIVGVLGLEVDPKRRTLWAVSANLGEEQPMKIPEPATVGQTALYEYDLATHKLKNKYLLNVKNEQHGFNDIAVSSERNVYVTDTTFNAVYKLDSASGVFQLLIKSDNLSRPNGIALSSDQKTLYIAHLEGMTAFDIASQKSHPVESPADITLVQIDGLVSEGSSLIAVQFFGEIDRIIRFQLAENPAKILSAEVLQNNHSLFELPTTGVVAENYFYFIANSQLQSFDEKGNIFPAEKLHEVIIMRVPLQD